MWRIADGGGIEVHTGDEPFRIITNGFPRLAGKTIVERREWIQEHADELRSAMMLELRGHADMYGRFLTEPAPALWARRPPRG